MPYSVPVKGIKATDIAEGINQLSRGLLQAGNNC